MINKIKIKIIFILKYISFGRLLYNMNIDESVHLIDSNIDEINKKNLAIPRKDLEYIAPGLIEINLLEKDNVDGNVSLSELCCISSIVKYYKIKKVFEIGTFDGRTTVNICANCADEVNIQTLDLPRKLIDDTQYELHEWEKTYAQKNTSGTRFLNSKYSKCIKQILCDSAQYESKINEEKFDLVFVDGSHTENYVINDTELALRLIKDKNGIIIWHDYNSGWEDVTKVMESFYKNDPRFKNMVNIKETSLLFLKT